MFPGKRGRPRRKISEQEVDEKLPLDKQLISEVASETLNEEEIKTENPRPESPTTTAPTTTKVRISNIGFVLEYTAIFSPNLKAYNHNCFLLWSNLYL